MTTTIILSVALACCGLLSAGFLLLAGRDLRRHDAEQPAPRVSPWDDFTQW